MEKRVWVAFLGAITLAAAVLLAGTYLGASRWLGAHPFWQVQVVWIGLGAGLILALGVQVSRVSVRISTLFALVFLAISLLAAYIGKTRFAASYAEDYLAGKFWYYGSMAVAAALFVCLFVALHQFLRRRVAH